MCQPIPKPFSLRISFALQDSVSNRASTVLHEYSHMLLDTVDHLDASGPREPDANYWANLPKWAWHWGMLGVPKGLDTEFGRVIQIEQSFGYIDPPKK